MGKILLNATRPLPSTTPSFKLNRQTVKINEQLKPDAARSLADDFATHETLIDRAAKPSILKVHPINLSVKIGEALGQQPQLCGPLWYEGELCVLFADTNVGKSVLAVQIAEMIARGRNASSTVPELRPQTDARKVLYIDFELSAQQFAKRYTSPDDRESHYRFSEKLYRAEIDYNGILAGSDVSPHSGRRMTMGELAYDDIEKIVTSSEGCKVVIIDNITLLAEGTETAAEALPLMKRLIALKKKHDLSILILAHTPKRNSANPITHNDLQGSKMIINFVDSAFAIGASTKSTNLRYIKQLKQRNCECVYHGGNVLDCVIDRTVPEFLGFKSIGSGAETRHLADPSTSKEDKQSRRKMVRELFLQGMDNKQIAMQTGFSLSQVYRIISAKADDYNDVKAAADTTDNNKK